MKAIVEQMKTLDTGKVVDEGAKMIANEGNKESKDKMAEEVGKDKDEGDGTMEVEKVKEEEEPDFGVEEDNEVEFQKVVETDKDVAADATIPLKAVPSAKARARSSPPI